jgi:hypothetical protein
MGNQTMDHQDKLAILGTQETGETKQKSHHYTQANTNNVNKIRALLQTTGGKHEHK